MPGKDCIAVLSSAQIEWENYDMCALNGTID